MEGHLWKIIQKHLDDYGVREAEFARRIGTSPQTVSSWKKRGIRSLPTKDLLVGVSDVTRQPYDVVLTAVLHDIKYLPKDVVQDAAPKTQAGGRPAKSASDGDNVKPGPWPDKEQGPPIPEGLAADVDHDPPRAWGDQSDPREGE